MAGDRSPAGHPSSGTDDDLPPAPDEVHGNPVGEFGAEAVEWIYGPRSMDMCEGYVRGMHSRQQLLDWRAVAVDMDEPPETLMAAINQRIETVEELYGTDAPDPEAHWAAVAEQVRDGTGWDDPDDADTGDPQEQEQEQEQDQAPAATAGGAD